MIRYVDGYVVAKLVSWYRVITVFRGWKTGISDTMCQKSNYFGWL